MAKTIRINYPVLMRRMKEVQFYDIMSTMLTGSFGALTLYDQHSVDLAADHLKKSQDSFSISIKQMKNAKGQILNQIIGKYASQQRASRPIQMDVIYILCATYLRSILTNVFDPIGVPLYEAVDIGTPMSSGRNNKVMFIDPKTVFTKTPSMPGVTAYQLLLTVDDFLVANGQILQPTLQMSAIKDFVDNMILYFGPSSVKPATAVSPALLALIEAVKIIQDFISIFSSAQGTYYSVTNAQPLSVPETLNGGSNTQFIKDYAERAFASHLFEDELQSGTSKMYLKDLITFNKRTGFWELAPNIPVAVYQYLMAFYLNVVVPTDTFALKFAKRVDRIQDYLELKAMISAYDQSTLSEDDRLLAASFLKFSTASQTVVFTRQYTTMAAEKESLEVYENILRKPSFGNRSTLDWVLDAIKNCYSLDAKFWLSGYAKYWSYDNQNQIIFRLVRNTQDRSDRARLVSFLTSGQKRSTVTYINDENVKILPTPITSPEVYFKRFTGMEDCTGGSNLFPVLKSNKYGTVVSGVNFQSLLSTLLFDGTYLEVEVDDDRGHQACTCYAITQRYTIDPPKFGQDNISFGGSSRKENPTYAYRIRPLDVEGADIIDLLTSFRQSEVYAFANDSERLKEIFLSRITHLGDIVEDIPACVIPSIRFVDTLVPSLSYIVDRFADDAASLGDNGLYKKLTRMSFLPHNATTTELSNRMITPFAEVDRYGEIKVVLPWYTLQTKTLSILNAGGDVRGPALANKLPSFEIINQLDFDPGRREVYVEAFSDTKDNWTDVLTKDENAKLSKVANYLGITAKELLKFIIVNPKAVVCVIRYDLKNQVTYFGGNVVRDTKSTSVAGKIKVPLAFPVTAIMSKGKSYNMTWLLDGVPVDCNKIFKRYRLNDTEADGNHDSDIYSSIMTLLFQYTLAIGVAASRVWGNAFTFTDHVDKAVAASELDKIQDFLSSAFRRDCLCSVLGPYAAVTIGDLCGDIKTLVGDLNNKSTAGNKLYDDCLAILYCFGITSNKFELYQLSKPLPIDVFDDGYVESVVKGNLFGLALPKNVSSLSGFGAEDFIVPEISTQLKDLVIQHIDDGFSSLM